MASALSTYAFLNAKLRARISTLLDEEFFRALARTRSFEEAVGRLAGTRYEAALDAYNRTGDVKLMELELVRAEWAALGDLDRYTPAAIEPFTRAVVAEFELATLKHSLRLWFERTVRGRPVDDKVAYLLRDDRVGDVPVDDIVNAGSPEEIERALAGQPYVNVIRNRLAEVEPRGSLFFVEVALDRWFFSNLLTAANELDRRDAEIAKRLLGIQIDIRNVNWIVRMKRYYRIEDSDPADSIVTGGHLMPTDSLRAAYASDRPLDPLLGALGSRYAALVSHQRQDDAHGVERLALLEEILRSILFQEIHRALGGYPFTIGTVLAYFLLVQNEVRVLISVLNARYYDVPPEKIEELV